MGDQLYRALEEAILNGDLGPGQRLNEQELARHFGVSRIPLREALRALEAGGLIEIQPRRGARVKGTSELELVQLTEVRRILESRAAEIAATERSEDQLRELEAVVSQDRFALRSKDRARLVKLNTEFHAIVGACTKNEVLADILVALNKRVRRYLWMVTLDRMEQSLVGHKELVEAIKRRQAKKAGRVATLHVAATEEAGRSALRGKKAAATGDS